MKKNFWVRLKESAIVLDGAMGTMINSFDIPKGECHEYLNLVNKELISQIHREYLEAGAEIITTNTFGANRYILDYFGLGNRVAEINRCGVEILKSLPGDFYIAASIGPLTRPYEEIKKINKNTMKKAFKEQIEALLSSGVDLLKFETFSNLEELLTAVKIAKKLDSKIPISCSMVYLENGKTMFGISPVEAAGELKKAGVQIIGSNCGIGPQSIFQIIDQIISYADYTIVYPNAGRPAFSYGKFQYPATPDYFAAYTSKFLKKGVNIIGGCCGTTPAHIKKIKEVIEKEGLTKVREYKKTTKKIKVTPERITFPNEFKKRVKSEFVMTVEVDPPKTVGNVKIVNYLRKLKAKNVAGVNIADNPLGKLRQSTSALSYIAKREIGLDVIIHFTCRDKNLLGIQSELLSMASLGINNILALTGDPPSVGDYPFATAVYEVNALGLIGIIHNLNIGKDYLNNSINTMTDYFIGTAAGPSVIDNKRAADHLNKKISNGANFIQTQPFYDVASMEKMMEVISKSKKPVIIGMLPLLNHNHAEFLNNEVSGISIPRQLIQKFENRNKEDSRKISIEIAVNLIEKIKELADGVCIMTPFNRYKLVLDIMDEMRM